MNLYGAFTLYFLSILLEAGTGRCYPSQSNAIAAASVANNFPDPNVDPFYKAPSNISSYAPGAVIRSRQVVTTVSGPIAQSFQAFYRTTDTQGNAVGSVATIWVPTKPLSPPRLFSFPQAEDALNIDCAPSWAWVNQSSTMESFYKTTSFIIPWALNQGYYVVVSDSEGPTSSWLVGLTEGRATLDGMRATIGVLGLPTSQTQIALLSYSGGAHSIVWASSFAEQYAPELKIVGAAFGGTPVDLRSAYNLLNGSPQALLALAAIIGLANGYPQLNTTLNGLYTANGSATVAQLRAPNFCPNVVPFANYAGVNVSTAYTRTDLLSLPLASVILAKESLLSNVSSFPVPVPKFPRFQWHGTADQTVPYGVEAIYVQQQCSKGADIRFVSFPGLDHAPALFAGIPGALLFINQAFAGTVPKVTCGANITVPIIGSSTVQEIVGISLAAFLSAEAALEGFLS